MSIVDFHSHLMPEVDDGAASDAEASDALRAFAAQDVSHVVATPHVNGSLSLRADLLAQRLEELDRAWERLQRLAREHVPGLKLFRGAEVALDTPVPVIADERLRLAGSRFVLCEFPFMAIPPNSSGVLDALKGAGVTPIIAHPERYVGVTADCALAAGWKQAGALLQINAGSLTGRYGDRARDNAHALLGRGLGDYLCSDYHARGRPATAGACAILVEMGGEEQLRLLTSVNPMRMLEGEDPVPVAPLTIRRSMADRVRRWFR
jgi:protein-tyrosine phosphatase